MLSILSRLIASDDLGIELGKSLSKKFDRESYLTSWVIGIETCLFIIIGFLDPIHHRNPTLTISLILLHLSIYNLIITLIILTIIYYFYELSSPNKRNIQ